MGNSAGRNDYYASLVYSWPHRDAAPQASGFSWSMKGMPDQFKRYLLVAGIFAIGNSSDMFLLLRA